MVDLAGSERQSKTGASNSAPAGGMPLQSVVKSGIPHRAGN